MTDLVLERMPTAALPGWARICAVDDLESCWGEAALVNGTQVALFRLPGGRIHAVDNRDPRTSASVMARGLIGSRGGTTTLASPLHKEVYSLATGECLTGGQPNLPVYETRVVDGCIEVAALAPMEPAMLQ
ncbi:nitrite reductase small subunit NirD [Arthrobacter sp. Br18]|uniref:nitrite reductase small subunit NirD n=1 Tax=Arthrobacter sp. Br18 TaxID=1312954 RepID=UPI0004B5F848|nr:nitrite reductase small subunit NirD [Arthrobacter sp. Br18]